MPRVSRAPVMCPTGSRGNWPENIGRKSTAGYAEFHQMNDLAAELAVMPATARLNLKASK